MHSSRACVGAHADSEPGDSSGSREPESNFLRLSRLCLLVASRRGWRRPPILSLFPPGDRDMMIERVTPVRRHPLGSRRTRRPRRRSLLSVGRTSSEALPRQGLRTSRRAWIHLNWRSKVSGRPAVWGRVFSEQTSSEALPWKDSERSRWGTGRAN